MTALEIALEYIGRGWAVVPIPHKKKKPLGEEWPGWRITIADAHQRFNGGPQNVGVILGEASGGLTDVDLDTAEATRAAGYFLQRTLCFGRRSKPCSHWLYQSGLWQTEDKAAIQFKFATGTGKARTEQMILELRIGGGGKGAQTVFPGSVHETGELIAWDDARETVAQADGAALKQHCARAAAAALIAGHFPSKGARHDAGLTLGGFLSRCGFSRPDAELFSEAVTIASGQPMEKVKDVRKAAREAWDEASRPGGRARGFPAFAETFGEDVAKHVSKWLGFNSENAQAQNKPAFTNGEAAQARVIDTKAPFATAKLFLENYASGGARTLNHHRGAFYAWNGRAYLERADGELRSEIYPFLDKSFSADSKGNLSPVKPNTSIVTNVLDALRAASHLDGSIAAPAWLRPVSNYPAEEIVACKNGLLHLPSGKIVDNTPEFFTYNALDFAYDEHAPEPKIFLNFLLQLWPNDSQSICTLQEIFGYCLTCDTRQQKAFLLVGPRRSGKGTIARVLARLIGTGNTVAPTLAGIGTNFGIAPLIGKRVAIISDARLGGRADQHAIAERILSITGEDALTIDRKYSPAWTGQLQTRFVVISNELPRLADTSGALASRFIVLLLTESFYGREDQTLTAKLFTELPGILNWAITGWHRLQNFGHFKQPDSALDAVQQLEDLGSPIAAFIREKCDIGPAHEVAVDWLFQAWCEWCQAQGRDHPGTKQSFGRDIRAACPGLKSSQRGPDGDRHRTYSGIRCKP
jgi:putative DNA primase/helicase